MKYRFQDILLENMIGITTGTAAKNTKSVKAAALNDFSSFTLLDKDLEIHNKIQEFFKTEKYKTVPQ